MCPSCHNTSITRVVIGGGGKTKGDFHFWTEAEQEITLS